MRIIHYYSKLFTGVLRPYTAMSGWRREDVVFSGKVISTLEPGGSALQPPGSSNAHFFCSECKAAMARTDESDSLPNIMN